MVRHGIELDSEAMRRFCRKWKIKELSVFGSILRDDFGSDSDVDFIAAFDSDADWDLSDHVNMQNELCRIVGRKADLLTRYAIDTDPNWLFRKAVLSSVETVYAG